MQSSKLHPGLVIWVNSKRLVESLGGFPLVPVEELLSDQTKATTRGLRHEDIAFRAAASGFPTKSAFCGSWTCGDAFFARSSVVLLKNTGVLPLTKGKVHRSLGGKKSSKLGVICGL